MKAGPRPIPAGFSFVNKDIIAKIEGINSRLRTLERRECAYRLLLTRDVLVPQKKGYVYKLSLVRQEHGTQQPGNISTVLQGVVQIICSRTIKFLADEDEDSFYPNNMSAYSCIHTYKAAQSMNDRD